MNLTEKEREQINELRYGWVPLLMYFGLLFTPVVVGMNAGQRWECVAWFAVLGIWLLIRPWRFGLIPGHLRSTMKLQGILVLGFFALFALIKLLR